MDLAKTYRALLIISALSYLAYYFFSYLYEVLRVDSLLSYNGYEAKLIFPSEVYWALLVTRLVAMAGMFLFFKKARLVFLVLVLIVSPMSILNGVSVLTPAEAFLIDVSNLMNGAILAIAFLSPLKSRFK